MCEMKGYDKFVAAPMDVRYVFKYRENHAKLLVEAASTGLPA